MASEAIAEGTLKGFTVGMHRVCPPADFLPRIRPLLADAGVTRLANITGLDRIGIAVVSAIRPAGSTLSAAAGKGLTLEAATVSAAMEAIEVFSAETAQVTRLCMSAENVARTEATLTLDKLPLRRHALLPSRQPIDWTFAYDLLENTRIAVPTDLVTLTPPRLPIAPFFQSSNGLASGAVYVEALLAGLLEVIERDALACWQSRTLRGRPTPRINLKNVRQLPLVGRLLAQLETAHMQPILYDCTVDTGVPVYFARLFDVTQRGTGVFYGSGAHLDREIALVRALTEAAQSRAVYIAGSRDDILRREFAQFKAQDTTRVIAVLEEQPPTVGRSDLESLATPTFEADIEYLLASLKNVGVEHVAVVDLTPPAFSGHVSVVRVIAEGLAGPSSDLAQPAQRAEQFAVQRAA
jgi:ribosomal protein S12 methylthiotransferase accessory factor